MSAAGQQLGLRLFLEGIEVPVIAANVQININSPASAAIQVVPGEKVLELKARTMVHLFFWDYTLDNEPDEPDADPQSLAAQMGITVDEARETIAQNQTTDVDLEMQGYKLLFSGEVVGVVFLKTPSGRQAILQCSDFSTYWDTTYQFFVSYSPGGNMLVSGEQAAVWAGSDSLFDDITEGHVSVMNEYLHKKPLTPGLTKVKGLMGGIISMLEAMGGVPRHTHGVNDFFTIAELKNHLLQQITAEQTDDTAQRLFDEKAFMDWLTRGMSSLGQLTTFRDMIKLLFNYIYYEVVPNPAAMYVRGKQSQTNSKRVSFTTKQELPPQLKQNLADIYYYVVQKMRLTRDDTLHLQNEVVYATNAKALLRTNIQSDQMPRYYKDKLTPALTILDKVKLCVRTVSGATIVGNEVEQDVTVSSNINEGIYQDNRNIWKKVAQILRNILTGDFIFSGTRNVVTKTAPELDQLHTQIFRPDCFFAAPPKCNVIFPDQYTQFQFTRNFLQETTRLRLSVDWLFGADSSGLLAEYHFAPSTADIKKIAKQQGNAGIRALLPWEIYSGILPKFESIHEMNYVAGAAERRKGIKGNIKGAAVSYAQRTANFNYMKYRFAARTAEVTLKFNPFVVCGFPAAIIEKPFIVDPDDAERIRESAATNKKLTNDDIGEFVKVAAQELNAPKQYLGMVAAISHNVQQDGGATSIVMTHARTHRITDDDFLSLLSTRTVTGKRTVATVLDAEEIFRKGDYRLLKFLRDATPQDLAAESQTVQDQQNNLNTDSDTSPPIETRPTGAPSVPTFGTLTNPLQAATKPISVKVPLAVGSGQFRVPMRGKVSKATLAGTRQTILVPDSGDGLKVRVGAKGPRGGTITQIQCVSDAAFAIPTKDIQVVSELRKSSIFGAAASDIADHVGASPQTSKAAGQIAENIFNPTRTSVVIASKNVYDAFTKTSDGQLFIEPNIPNNQLSFFWKKIVIYETVSDTTITTVLPVEESLRPPWFSPLYSNWFIGDEIYQPFFGCGSVVDQAMFIAEGQVATFGTGKNQQQKLLDDLKNAGNDKDKILQLVADAKAKNIADVPDIESSVDMVAYIYGEVRRLGLDVHRFVNDYTRRPIATMRDIFGSMDLSYKINTATDTLTLDTGEPGFHSTAIADVGGRLRGLVDDPDLQLSRLKKDAGKKSPISRDLDPRPGRRSKVLEYVEEIGAATGTLGIGVAG